MSNFCGNNAQQLPVMMMLIFCLAFFFMVGSSSPAAAAAAAAAAAEGNDNNFNIIVPLFELTANRDEVVRMAGYGEEKLSTVLITGSLHCEAHFPTSAAHQPHAWPIPGATVGVNCHSRHASERRGKSAVVARGATDEFGDFIVDLPSHLHAIPNLENICTVKVHRVPKGTLCRPAAAHMKRHNQLRLSSFGNGIRTYSAGNIRLLHQPP